MASLPNVDQRKKIKQEKGQTEGMHPSYKKSSNPSFLKVIQESQLKLRTTMGKLEKTQENPLAKTETLKSSTEGIACRHYMKGNCHYGTACRFVHCRHNLGNDTTSRSSHPDHRQGNRHLNTHPRHTDNREHPVDTRHRSDRHRSNRRYRDTDMRDTYLSNSRTRQQPY